MILKIIMYKTIENGQEKMINDYYLEQELGQGQCGTVYIGRHKETNQIYAVKVIEI